MLRIFSISGLYRKEKSPDYYEHTAMKAVKDTAERFQRKNATPLAHKATFGNSDKGGK